MNANNYFTIIPITIFFNNMSKMCTSFLVILYIKRYEISCCEISLTKLLMKEVNSPSFHSFLKIVLFLLLICWCSDHDDLCSMVLDKMMERQYNWVQMYNMYYCVVRQAFLTNFNKFILD